MLYVSLKPQGVTRPSVCPSVTLSDCDHTLQQKWKWAHDGIGRCLGYLRTEADPDHSIHVIPGEDERGRVGNPFVY